MDNWIYEHSDDNTSRYALGTKGERTLICFGVNPSTAEPTNLDPTLKSVERIALQHGYDSFLMLNLYPQRATNPKDMDKTRNRKIGKKNLEVITKYLSQGNCDIWAAWGTLITTRPYLASYLYNIYYSCHGQGNNWYTRGNISKDGHPHHPLYVKKTDTLKSFDMDEYLTKYITPLLYANRKDDLQFFPVLQSDLHCKDCIFRYDTTTVLGNISRCEVYPDEKPNSILLGNKCDEYVID